MYRLPGDSAGLLKARGVQHEIGEGILGETDICLDQEHSLLATNSWKIEPKPAGKILELTVEQWAGRRHVAALREYIILGGSSRDNKAGAWRTPNLARTVFPPVLIGGNGSLLGSLHRVGLVAQGGRS